jgi:hypothetical protein
MANLWQIIIRGRWLRFGGLAVIVVAIFALMWVAVYAVVKQASLRADFSQTDLYALTPDSEALVRVLAQDNSVPDMHMLVFLGVAQAGARDRVQVLLDDYVRESNGRITYEFIDPDRDPITTRTYNASAGQARLIPRNDAGTLNTAQSRTLFSLDQQSISDALIALSATGDYRAYFLAVDDTLDINDSSAIGMSILAEQLRNRFNWRVQMVSLFDLERGTLDDGTPLLDTSADGEVLVIAGGSFALTQERFAPLQRYLDAGGSLVVFAGVNTQGGTALVTDANFNALINRRWGVQINNDLVVDPDNAVGTLFVTRASRWGETDMVALYTPDDHVDFIAPHSLSADELRDDVLITSVIYSSDTSYAKPDFDFSQNVSAVDLGVTAEDVLGSQLLGALSLHLASGARGAFFASDSLVYNEYEADQSAGTRNIALARDAILWAGNFDNRFASLATSQLNTRPADVPLNASLQQLNGIQFASVFVMPAFVLLIGFMVWWRNRG